jgi:hypothetical protein
MRNMNNYARDARECKEPVGALADLTNRALMTGPVPEMREVRSLQHLQIRSSRSSRIVEQIAPSLSFQTQQR